jgi:hypothetical protein
VSTAIMIPPSRPNITRLSDESVMVRWSVPSDEGLPIQFFKVQYRDLNRRGSQWMTIDDDIPPHIRSYEVDTLKTDHSYRYLFMSKKLLNTVHVASKDLLLQLS